MAYAIPRGPNFVVDDRSVQKALTISDSLNSIGPLDALSAVSPNCGLPEICMPSMTATSLRARQPAVGFSGRPAASPAAEARSRGHAAASVLSVAKSSTRLGVPPMPTLTPDRPGIGSNPRTLGGS